MEMQYKGRRLIRQSVSSSLVASAVTYSSLSARKKSCQREKRGSGDEKKLVKKSSQMVKEKFEDE